MLTVAARGLFRTAAAFGLAFACGCFPAITHGARVEDGWIAGLMAGSTTGDVHTEGDEGGFHLRQAMIGPFVGYGAASARPTQPGYYIAAAVPLFFPVTQIDAYLQLPPAWTPHLAAGLGGTASLESLHGYAMLGGDLDRAISWYVAGGYGSRQSSSRFQSTSPAWFGNAGIIMRSGFLRTQLFVESAAGRIPGSCFTDPITQANVCNRGEDAQALSFGVSFGRQQHHARQR